MRKKILLMFMVLMSAMTLWAQTLTINQPSYPCTVTANPSAPIAGQTVTLTVNMNNYPYVLWTINDLMVTDVVNNRIITVTRDSSTPDPLYYFDSPGNYTFTMPNGDVVVDVNLRDVFPLNCQGPLNGSGRCQVQRIGTWGVPNPIFNDPQYVEVPSSESVTLTASPDMGLSLASYYVVAPSGSGNSMIVNNTGVFPMPNDPVDVYPNFVGSGEFFVNIDPNIDQGQVMVQAIPPSTPVGNEMITLNIMPFDQHDVVNNIEVRTLDNQTTAPVFFHDGEYKFKLPGQDVAVYVTWDYLSDGPNPHQITVITDGNGQVPIANPNPNPGERILLNPLPNQGYVLDQIFLKFTLSNGKQSLVEVLPNPSDEYWFTMPGADVEVKATFKRAYKLYVSNANDDPRGSMDVLINGESVPFITNGNFDEYFPVFENDVISVTAYPTQGYGVIEFYTNDMAFNPIDNYPASSNGTASFEMPNQDIHLFANYVPCVTLEVVRGNPSVGTLEVVSINNTQPPTPTVNSNNNYEYQTFEGEPFEFRCNPAPGYRATTYTYEVLDLDGNVLWTYTDYYTSPSVQNNLPGTGNPLRMKLWVDYVPYLSTLVVESSKVQVNRINNQTPTPASQNGDYNIYYVYDNDRINVRVNTPPGYTFNQFVLNSLDPAYSDVTYPGYLFRMPPYDAMLTAEFTPIDYKLSVPQQYPGHVTRLVDTNGWTMSPDPFLSSPTVDVYIVHVDDEIGVEVTGIPNPSVFVQDFRLLDQNGFLIRTYAGPSVPKIVMPAHDATLMTDLYNGVAPWQPNAYALKVDKNIPNGTLNILTINGTPAPRISYYDYDVYYPVYPGDPIQVTCTTNLTWDDCTLYDTNIFPTNKLEDYSMWSWAPTGNFPAYTFYMPGQDALLTGAFRGDTLGITVKQMDINGNKVSILINGQTVVPRWSYVQGGEYYEDYDVLYDDEITVIGEPIDGFAVRTIDRYHWDDPTQSIQLFRHHSPTEGPLYPSSLTTFKYNMPMIYGWEQIVVDFRGGSTLQVDQRAPNGTGNMTDGSLTEVYRNGVLMTPVGTSPNSIDYFPIYENDVVIVRNVPDPGYTNVQYVLDPYVSPPSPVNIPPDAVPATGTFLMPGCDALLTGQFALNSYNINILSTDGTTNALISPPPGTPITTGQLGNTVYIDFVPNSGFDFDPAYFTVTYSGGADAQPTLVPATPPYQYAWFIWQVPEDVYIEVHYQNQNPSPLRGDVNGDNVVDINDLTDLIDYLLSILPPPIPAAADCDEDGTVGISDVTVLIDRILSGHW